MQCFLRLAPYYQLIVFRMLSRACRPRRADTKVHYAHSFACGWPSMREVACRLSPTANISMQINEMGLKGPKNTQLPRGFASGDRTLETAENGKIGL